MKNKSKRAFCSMSSNLRAMTFTLTLMVILLTTFFVPQDLSAATLKNEAGKNPSAVDGLAPFQNCLESRFSIESGETHRIKFVPVSIAKISLIDERSLVVGGFITKMKPIATNETDTKGGQQLPPKKPADYSDQFSRKNMSNLKMVS